MSEPRIRALIAEDEAPARDSLRDYLADAPWIEVVVEAVDGRSALALAEQHRPDLLFLDVRLPEAVLLEVARRDLYPARSCSRPLRQILPSRPRIGALAICQAGSDGAPGRRRRLRGCAPAPAGGCSGLGPGAQLSDTRAPARLFARQGTASPDPVEGIRRIQAQGDYARYTPRHGVFLLHVTLGELAARLDPGRFRQVHRSHIVNLDQVEHLRPYDERRLAITLKDGSVVVASRAASEELRRLAR